MEQGRTAPWLLKLIIRSFRCSFAGTKDMYIYIYLFSSIVVFNCLGGKQ